VLLFSSLLFRSCPPFLSFFLPIFFSTFGPSWVIKSWSPQESGENGSLFPESACHGPLGDFVVSSPPQANCGPPWCCACNFTKMFRMAPLFLWSPAYSLRIPFLFCLQDICFSPRLVIPLMSTSLSLCPRWQMLKFGAPSETLLELTCVPRSCNFFPFLTL